MLSANEKEEKIHRMMIGCIGVSICHTDGSCKIFDSRARDEYGRRHPLGTCVLLEVTSIQT